MPARTHNWSALHADPRFLALHRRKSRFLSGLMILSVIYYFALPIGAGYFPELYRQKVWGPLNVGFAFAFSQFVMAWAIAFVYARRANGEFDRLAAELKAAHGEAST
jgi:uncharacterized membrane protein (DUF485 family)